MCVPGQPDPPVTVYVNVNVPTALPLGVNVPLAALNVPLAGLPDATVQTPPDWALVKRLNKPTGVVLLLQTDRAGCAVPALGVLVKIMLTVSLSVPGQPPEPVTVYVKEKVPTALPFGVKVPFAPLNVPLAGLPEATVQTPPVVSPVKKVARLRALTLLTQAD